MLGIIVRIPKQQKYGIIISYDDNRYYFSAEDCDPRLKLSISDDVEFTPLTDTENRRRSFFRKFASVTDIVKYQIPNERNGFYLSSFTDTRKLKVTEVSRSYVLVGESPNKEHALDLMIETAVNAGCTALTDIKVKAHVPKFNNNISFIIEGVPARGEKVDRDRIKEQENRERKRIMTPKEDGSRSLDEVKFPRQEKTIIVEPDRIRIPPEKIRLHSPNRNKRLFQRMVISIIMLLMLPLIGTLAQAFNNIYESLFSILLILFAEIGLVVIYYSINPRKSCCFFRIKHGG